VFGAASFPRRRWPWMQPYEVSLVEQAVCVRALAFVASGLSAWSGNVVRNRTIRVWERAEKWPLNEAQHPHFHSARVVHDTRYSRVEGDRRASRNGPVSSSPARNP
jgi:hypothetical protein